MHIFNVIDTSIQSKHQNHKQQYNVRVHVSCVNNVETKKKQRNIVKENTELVRHVCVLIGLQIDEEGQSIFGRL